MTMPFSMAVTARAADTDTFCALMAGHLAWGVILENAPEDWRLKLLPARGDTPFPCWEEGSPGRGNSAARTLDVPARKNPSTSRTRAS